MLTKGSIVDCIARADRLDSKIDPGIFGLNSPSGRKGRCLMNNLGRLFGDDLRYLEVGTERGVAYVSVLNGIVGGPKYSMVIDPWPNDWIKPDFDANVTRFLPGLRYNQLNLLIEDCFTVDLKRIESKINFYFYDAMHDYASQKRAFTYFNPVLEDRFLTVVDDWNDRDVRGGTYEAFEELGYQFEFAHEIPTQYWDTKGGAGDRSTYWNGLGVFLINKKAAT